MSKDQLLDAVRSTDLDDQLHHLGVVISAISTNDEKAAIDALGDGKQTTGDEGFAVMRLLEDLDLLTKTGAVDAMLV